MVENNATKNPTPLAEEEDSTPPIPSNMEKALCKAKTSVLTLFLLCSSNFQHSVRQYFHFAVEDNNIPSDTGSTNSNLKLDVNA
jgi:hypothetical protein